MGVVFECFFPHLIMATSTLSVFLDYNADHLTDMDDRDLPSKEVQVLGEAKDFEEQDADIFANVQRFSDLTLNACFSSEANQDTILREFHIQTGEQLDAKDDIYAPESMI